jgi:hypothetical protein
MGRARIHAGTEGCGQRLTALGVDDGCERVRVGLLPQVPAGGPSELAVEASESGPASVIVANSGRTIG